MRLIDMLPPELDAEMSNILIECIHKDPFFDPLEYECQSFALQILLAREVVRQRQATQVKYEVVSSAPYTEATIQDIEDDQWLQDLGRDIDDEFYDIVCIKDLLSLVDMEVPLETIETWSDEDLGKAEIWASATALRASDNYDVKVPKMPKVLKPYKNK